MVTNIGDISNIPPQKSAFPLKRVTQYLLKFSEYNTEILLEMFGSTNIGHLNNDQLMQLYDKAVQLDRIGYEKAIREDKK